MEIGPLARASVGASVTGANSAQETLWLTQAVVAAIHKLNRPELERGREFKMRKRAAGQRPIVDVLDRETGDILDELPPEAVLRMAAELEKDREGDL